MKNVFSIAILAFAAYSCGEAGLGFNVGTEFPLTLPVEGADFPPDPFGINPPEFSESDSYSLSKDDELADQLDDIEDVVVNSLSYSISGVSASEQIEVEALSIELFIDGSSIGIIDIAGDLPASGLLSDIEKRAVSGLNLTQLSSVLNNRGEIGTEVIFDFGEFPEGEFGFDFTFYFDVTAKLRDF